MRQCQKCYTPNDEESQYCANCGAPLRQGETSRPTAMIQEANAQHSAAPVQYPVPKPSYRPLPPPPPTYTQNYAPTQLASRGTIASPQKSERKKRSGVGLFFGILLYLLGGFTAAFGLASIFMSKGNITIGNFAFVIGCLVSLLTLIFILIRHRQPRLQGWLRAVLFVGISTIAFILLIIIFMTNHANQSISSGEYIQVGIICLIDGVGTEVIALL